MISMWAPMALTASTGALLALPLAPAIRELMAKHDAGPLVTRKDDGKIANFADVLRQRCREFETIQSDADGAVEISGETIFAWHSGQWHGPQHLEHFVVCFASTRLPDNFQSIGNFYAKSDLLSGRDNIFRALLSDAEIVLAPGSQVLRWIHAESDLIVRENCSLFGRASSAASLTLASGCRFERIHAPVICSSAAAQVKVRSESAAFAKLARAGMGRMRKQGRAHLRAGEEHYGDMVATRGLDMEKGACIYGSVKANGNVNLGNEAEVDGSLVSTKCIHVRSGAFVKGPIISEREVIIDSGVQVGLPNSLTTVSAPHIRIAPGCVLHGTVWARAEGCVKD